mgnify:FL=1
MTSLDIILKVLDEKFPNPQASLHYTTPFTLLIATLLSAQCHDEQVNKVTPQLFAKADTPQQMQTLSEQEIGQLIHSCGFYKVKAHYIRILSQQLCDQFHGIVPNTFEELETLTGIGHKTASVVLGHAFGLPAFPVDTHVKRVAIRWGLSQGPSVEKVEEDLKFIFPQKDWFKRHLQMVLYGRHYCNHTACNQKHLCDICKNLQIS